MKGERKNTLILKSLSKNLEDDHISFKQFSQARLGKEKRFEV